MNELHRTAEGAGSEPGAQQDVPDAPSSPRARRIDLAYWAGACALSLLIWLGLIVAAKRLLD